MEMESLARSAISPDRMSGARCTIWHGVNSLPSWDAVMGDGEGEKLEGRGRDKAENGGEKGGRGTGRGEVRWGGSVLLARMRQSLRGEAARSRLRVQLLTKRRSITQVGSVERGVGPGGGSEQATVLLRTRLNALLTRSHLYTSIKSPR